MSGTAIAFPGQGAQKAGMGADFASRFPVGNDLFARANDVLEYDLRTIIFEGPEELLSQTNHCQPAIFVTSLAIVSAIESEGILDRNHLSFAAGLSLGEYSALQFAGAFAFEDALKLVANRGLYMQEASDEVPSGMISLLGADLAQAKAIVKAASEGDVLCVANVLSPGHIVLSGSMEAVKRVPDVAKAHGVRRARPLNVAGAFHSPLMASAAERLKRDLQGIEIQTPEIPVVSNVTGLLLEDPDQIRSLLAEQVVSPVLWQSGMEYMLEKGVGSFIEPGPGTVLKGLLRKIDSEAACRSFDSVDEIEAQGEV